MSTIPVGCRVDQTTIDDFDKLASERGLNRADLLRQAIAHELGNQPDESLEETVATLSARVGRLENVLMLVAGAISR